MKRRFFVARGIEDDDEYKLDKSKGRGKMTSSSLKDFILGKVSSIIHRDFDKDQPPTPKKEETWKTNILLEAIKNVLGDEYDISKAFMTQEEEPKKEEEEEDHKQIKLTDFMCKNPFIARNIFQQKN